MAEGEQQPVGVHIGVGGDPLILGVPAFCVGSLALGMGLIGMPAGLNVIAPLIFFSTGLFQLVTTCWAIILGISIVASIFGLFSGFWLSTGVLIIGTQHGWFGIHPDNLANAEQLYFIAYAVLFAFLFIPCLKLPVIYPAIIGLVVIALAFAAVGMLAIAGYFVLAFDFLGWYAFIHIGQTAMGAKAPPIG